LPGEQSTTPSSSAVAGQLGSHIWLTGAPASQDKTPSMHAWRNTGSNVTPPSTDTPAENPSAASSPVIAASV
jgi:hypothetical protein